jgi:hypothetical protein
VSTVEQAFAALRAHWEKDGLRDMRKAFAGDAARFTRFSARLDDFLLDW